MNILKLNKILSKFYNLIVLSETKKSFDFWGKEGAGLLFICNEDNTVFLVLRSANVMQANTWGTYGGKLEEGETPQQAAFREAKEELGSIPKLGKLIDTIKFKDSNSKFIYTTFVYSVSLQDKNNWMPTLNWEADDFEWFPMNELPSNLHFGIKHIISLNRKKIPKFTSSNKWYHVTNHDRVKSILQNGLKINSTYNKSIGSIDWAPDVYGMNPIYISKNKGTYKGGILLEVNVDGLDLVADLPGLVDYGAYIDQNNSLIYFEEDEVPSQLQPFANEDGEIYFEDLMNSHYNVCKAAIELTETAAIMQNIPPENIKLLGDV